MSLPTCHAQRSTAEQIVGEEESRRGQQQDRTAGPAQQASSPGFTLHSPVLPVLTLTQN